MTTNRTVWASVALLVSAMAWGSTVVVAKSAYESISAVTLLTIRLVLTAIVLLAVLPTRLRMPRRTALQGLTLGLLFTTGISAQLVGLQYTPPSLSGFVTASYVVFTALISAVLLRQRQPVTTWAAVGLTIVGISVLAGGAATGVDGFGFGAALTLVGAFAFACHIVFLGRWVKRESVAQLTLMQALVGGAIALSISPFSGFEMPSDPNVWWPLLYLGVVAGAFTLFLQSWGQSHVAAIPSAVIMCTEPVFSVMFAIMFGFEQLTLHIVAGGSLVVGSLLLTVLSGNRARMVDSVLDEVRNRRRNRAA